jgi:hypothetical protein
MTPEKTIDVERSAIVRLLKDSLTEIDKHPMWNTQYHYWTGYIRALEHVLEMENE